MNERRQAARARAVIRLANRIHRAWPAAIPGGWMAWKAMTRPVVRGGTVAQQLEDEAVIRCSLTHARFHADDAYEGYSRLLFRRACAMDARTIVDVGANAGFFTVSAARAAPAALVHAFEPHPVWAGVLRENVQRNGLSNVTCHELALSNAGDQTARLHFAAAAGSHGFHSEAADGAGADVTTAIASDAVSSPPCIVKIDVEGHEEMVLRGMAPWLTGDHDMALFVEVIPELLARGGSSRQQVLKHIEPGGFDLFVIDDGNEQLVPLAAAGDNWPGRNLLALRGRFKQLAATEPAAAATH